MVKAQNKRVPPSRQNRTLRVWDKLEVVLSDRAISRDIRIIQQKASSLMPGQQPRCGVELSGVDTDCSQPQADMSDSWTSHKQLQDSLHPNAGTKKHLRDITPELQDQPGNLNHQFSSRSSSPSFPQGSVQAEAQVQLLRKRARAGKQGVEKPAFPGNAMQMPFNGLSAKLGGEKVTHIFSTQSEDLDGCALQHQQLALAQNPAKFTCV